MTSSVVFKALTFEKNSEEFCVCVRMISNMTIYNYKYGSGASKLILNLFRFCDEELTFNVMIHWIGDILLHAPSRAVLYEVGLHLRNHYRNWSSLCSQTCHSLRYFGTDRNPLKLLICFSCNVVYIAFWIWRPGVAREAPLWWFFSLNLKVPCFTQKVDWWWRHHTRNYCFFVLSGTPCSLLQ